MVWLRLFGKMSLINKTKNKVALINGITGQDGIYLAELLVSKNYKVIGAVRDVNSAKQKLGPYISSNIELIAWDMLNQNSICEVISKYSPEELYNFAAYSSGTGMFDEPVKIGEINGIAITNILEAIRKVNNKIRFCQASSREIFGDATESPQTELTFTNPRTPYGAAKLYADNMIKIYRKRYYLYACSAILYNHESPRRGLEFVTRKITHEAAKIKLGLSNELYLGDLGAKRDWGFAGDYVKGMWLMLQQPNATDYILATGESHSVRDFCEKAFSYLELDYRKYVKEDDLAFRPNELVNLVGSSTKAIKELKWYPKIGFDELVQMMVDADMSLLKENLN